MHNSSIYLNEEYKKYKVQYSFDVTNDNNWIDYLDGGIEVTENKAIYVRLTDGKKYTNYVQEDVISIDKTNPNDATIELSTTSTDTLTSITATVTHTDDDSGVSIENCKWIYNTTSSAIGTSVSSYIETFSSNPQTITLSATTSGTYYLHVLTMDNAGKWSDTSNLVTTAYPSTQGQFGIYDANDGILSTSKNQSIKPEWGNNKYKGGWRVLNVDKSTGIVTIVSAGTPILYYHSFDGINKYAYDSINNINNFCNKNFVNSIYATSARGLSYSDIGEPEAVTLVSKDVYGCSNYTYLTATAISGDWPAGYLLWHVSSGNTVYTNGSGCYGVRPVVTLKNNIYTYGKIADEYENQAWTLLTN